MASVKANEKAKVVKAGVADFVEGLRNLDELALELDSGSTCSSPTPPS